MKPLELIWYGDAIEDLPLPPRGHRLVGHIHGHGPGCGGWGCYPKHKRLTDAELAAEWHDWVAHMKHLQWSELSSENPLTDEQWAPVHSRAMTLWRFATHPHHDQEEA